MSNENRDQEIKNQTDDNNDSKRNPRAKTLKLVRVRFPGNPRAHTYRTSHDQYSHGEKVVANSDRGVDIGLVNSFIYERTFNVPFDPIDKIIRKATDEDIKKIQELEEKKKETKEKVSDLVNKHSLNMTISHITFTQWGKKLIIYYTAPERIDFRELLKDLASTFRLQIELRQISLLDRMVAIGGITSYGEVYSEYSLKKFED